MFVRGLLFVVSSSVCLNYNFSKPLNSTIDHVAEQTQTYWQHGVYGLREIEWTTQREPPDSDHNRFTSYRIAGGRDVRICCPEGTVSS